MHLGLTHPLFLVFLIALPFIVWIERRAWSGLVPWRRRVVLLCRLAEAACLVLALGGLRWEREREEIAVLFALDLSHSVPESARTEALDRIKTAMDAKRPSDRAGLLVFGRHPLVEVPPTEGRPDLGAITSEPDPEYTDLAALLRLSITAFPEGMRRRLVLFSDGNENRGRALDTVRMVRAAGVSIDVFPIESPPRTEVSLLGMDLPGRIALEEPFEVKIHAMSTHAGEATLRIFRDGAPLERLAVDLEPGDNTFAVTLVEDQPGFHTYEATIESPADSQMDNNVAGNFTRVTGPSRALLVGTASDNAGIANALDLSSLPYDLASDLPATLAGLQPYDTIILNNVAATGFTPVQMENIERYVRDLGGGLVMIGGENSFAPGGWIDTPVERALPVDMELKTKEKFPSLALAVVLDKSGSMGGFGGGASKMDLAIRATTEAVDLLGPRDQLTVVAFDSAAKIVVPMMPAERRMEINQRVRSIRAGGGTDAYAGLTQAYRQLDDTPAKLKHIILLTDGRTREADFQYLVDRMIESQITLSAVAIGGDADREFLAEISRRGGGALLSQRGRQPPAAHLRARDDPGPARLHRGGNRAAHADGHAPDPGGRGDRDDAAVAWLGRDGAQGARRTGHQDQ